MTLAFRLRVQRVLRTLFPLASLIMALAACGSSFLLVWGLMRSRIFPPGLEAGFQFLAMKQAAETSWLTHSSSLFPLLASYLMGFVSAFSALKLAAIAPLILLPLVVYFLAWRVTGSWLAGAAASWALVFYPALFPPLWMGEYPVLLGLLLVTSCLLFTLVSLRDGKLSLLALVVASLAGLLASLAHLTAGVVLVLTLAGWIICLSLAERRLRWRPLVILVFSVAPIIAYLQRDVVEPLAVVSPANLFLDPVTPFLLFSCALMGAYSLYIRSGWRTPALLGLWIWASLVSSALPPPMFRATYILSVPPLVVLATAPFFGLRDAFIAKRMNTLAANGSELEVTVDVNKAFALVLSSMFVAASLNYGFVSCSQLYEGNNYLGDYGDSELLDTLNWIKDSTPEDALVVTEERLIPWIEGYAERRTPPALSAETILSTNFRLLTRYLVVDEWQPFSSERAPYIAAFNGSDYSRLLYIDDSYARATLLEEGEQLVEAPSNCAFLGAKWLDRSSSMPGLRLRFATSHLFVDKTLRVNANSPEALITYELRAKAGVQLEKFSLPIWVEWGKGMLSKAVDGSKVFLTIAPPAESVEVKALGNFSAIEVGRSKDSGVERVYMEFTGSSSDLEAGVWVRVNSARSSGLRVWTGSMADLIKECGEGYIVSPVRNPSLLNACLVKRCEEPSLHLVDSYMNVHFKIPGSEWVEAPSQGRVLFEDNQSDKRLVAYETDGLYINKTLTVTENIVSSTYAIFPKENVSLTSMDLRLWIPWERALEGYALGGSGISLILDTGRFDIEVEGNVTSLEVGPDPELGQLRVFAELSLEPGGGLVSVLIESPEPTSMVYEATTRPEMVGSDSLYIYHYRGMLGLAYENTKIRVYEVVG